MAALLSPSGSRARAQRAPRLARLAPMVLGSRWSMQLDKTVPNWTTKEEMEMTYPTCGQTVATVPKRAEAYLQVPVALGTRQLLQNPAQMHFALSCRLPFTTGLYNRVIMQGYLLLLGSTRGVPHTRCSCPYARAWRCLPCGLF